MKTVDLYEVGEKVLVEATIMGITIDHGEIKYHLKNETTGRNYDHVFSEDQLRPCTDEIPTEAPVMVNGEKAMTEKEPKKLNTEMFNHGHSKNTRPIIGE